MSCGPGKGQAASLRWSLPIAALEDHSTPEMAPDTKRLWNYQEEQGKGGKVKEKGK